MKNRYRLGLDLGSNSIGWCAVLLDGKGTPCGVLDAGVRILTPNEEAGRDPQSKQSLAANRRAARSMRKRRDRFLRRRDRLMETLIEHGLMPADKTERKDLEKLDPYWLRAAALGQRLELPEIGRAIFHLNQRRGFKSNRITDSDDSEGNAMKAGMKALDERLKEAGARTLGQFLAERGGRDREGYLIDRLGNRVGRKTNRGVRFRPRAEGNKVLYDLYPTRAMIEHELEEIWKEQASHHDVLTPDLLARLKRIVIEQRPLKKPLVGRCTFRPDEERAPRALPLFQRFRILMEIANLDIERPGQRARKLTLQERDVLAGLLASRASAVTFEAMRRTLKLPDDASFNLERGKRKGLDHDRTAGILGKAACFGTAWRGYSHERQNQIAGMLLAEEDPERLVAWLMENCGLSREAAEAVGNARLPQGHAHIGRSMLADLIDVMKSESAETADSETSEVHRRPLTYDEAIERLGLHHSDLAAGKHPKLPYYGKAMARHVIANPAAPEGSQERIGRVPNPTVHIALNQMRALVNALIDAHGPPAEIVIELARELKQNRKQKDEATRRNRENEKANEGIREELAKMEMAYTHGNRLIMRLYRELPPTERVCVYSGRPITIDMIRNSAVEVDHILPRSKTLDDGFANKVLCTGEANREKGKRSPAEAWSGEALSVIHGRAKRLFPHKAWRFAPDAMERFGENNDFLARQLTDSQHMARLAKDYLGHLYGEDRNRRVRAVPGRLTAMLRGFWGLNALMSDHNVRGGDESDKPAKSRDDHRHHAVDAFVVACTDRGMLQRVATASGRAEERDLDRWAEKGKFPEPFEGYREALRAKLDAMVVSHKPDHGIGPKARGNVHVTSGKLHEETAYGLVDEEIDGKRFNLVTRKPLTALTEKEIGQVRDARLREELEEVAHEAKRDGEKLEAALGRFGDAKGIRRVRVLKTERYTLRIAHGEGRFEKAYVPGANHRIEIYETPDGKWHGEGVSMFDANSPGFAPRWSTEHAGAKLKLRFHKGDMFAADFGEGRKHYIVRKLSAANNRIEFVSDRKAGKIEASDYMQAAYSKLKAAGARRVRVDPIGRVKEMDDR